MTCPHLSEIVSDWVKENEDLHWMIMDQDDTSFIFNAGRRDGRYSPVFKDGDWQMGFIFGPDIGINVPAGKAFMVIYDESKDGQNQEYSTLLDPVHPDFFDQILEILEKKCEASPWEIPQHHWPCYNREVNDSCSNYVNWTGDYYRFPKDGRCEECWEKEKIGICAKHNICPICFGNTFCNCMEHED